jgi:hypothetical protein
MNRMTLLSPLAAACIAAACTTMVAIPEALQPGANSTLAMVVPAKGVQVYECRARKGADGHEWVFVAPDAMLFDVRGHRIGHHGAGPFWQSSDGSRVVGSVKAKADAPDGSIPWLLLTTKDAGPSGAFSRVTSIQRVNTVGGTTPAKPCTAAEAGQQARVPYTADYRFFAPSSLTTTANR